MDVSGKSSEPAGSPVLAEKADGIPRTSRDRGIRRYLKENAVLLLTFIGVVVGFAVGFGVRELDPSPDALMWIGMPGELFMRMLNLMVVPLVVSSVITGTASLDPKSNGKISLVAFTWITCTNILACVLALILSVTIRPGSGEGGAATEGDVRFETQDIFADLFRNIIPNNMVEVAFKKAQTEYTTNTEEVARNLTNGTVITETVTSRFKSNGKSDSVNVLGIIFIATILGIAAHRLGKKADIFVRFFAATTDIVILVLRWFFWTSPLGVASLIAKAIAGIDDLEDSFSKLGMPYFIGFAATSTAVALPEMLYCCEVKNGIDRRVARFAVPFSVTLSANGSAVFIVSAAIFIGQYIGYPLTAGDIVIIGILSAVSAMALPSVPSSSIITLVIILAAVNIPSGQIALLFAVEWFLDRLRTGTNVVSHCYCAAVTYQLAKKDLERQDREAQASGDTLPNGETNQAFDNGEVLTTRI
ncbi:hypothetical protein BaRGS_00023870 [Batillaria attramentaria]|uniref:Amino acid transporter n=1 Tax=Batillaria attramentaria TaxID=370345 RepID=A0ABD0KCN2_9CAEN